MSKKHHLQEEEKKTASQPDEAAAESSPEKNKGETETKQPQKLTDDEKLQKAGQEIAQLNDQLLRLRADFDNFRKRLLREKGEIYENANEALMLELLPALDHLQLAASSAKEHHADKALQEGIHMIFDQILDVLAKYGLVPFNSENQPFDPKLHEAISSLPSDTVPEGVIIAQSRQGYRFKNKLLRPAQVVVSSGKAALPRPETNKNHDDIHPSNSK